MPSLTLKPTHKAVTAYYDSLAKFTVSLETLRVVKSLPAVRSLAETPTKDAPK
jgi:hypothetical protein